MPPRLVAGDARSATQSAPVLRLLPAACSGNPRCPGPGRQCPADPSREAPARPRAPPPGACRSAQSRAGPGRHWHTLLSAPVFVFLRAVRRAPRCPGPSQRWPARESILPRPTPPSPGPLPCRPPSRATSAGTRALCGRPFWGRICIQRWQHPPARPAMGDPVSATGPPAGYAAPQPSLEVTAQRSHSPPRGGGAPPVGCRCPIAHGAGFLLARALSPPPPSRYPRRALQGGRPTAAAGMHATLLAPRAWRPPPHPLLRRAGHRKACSAATPRPFLTHRSRHGPPRLPPPPPPPPRHFGCAGPRHDWGPTD